MNARAVRTARVVQSVMNVRVVRIARVVSYALIVWVVRDVIFAETVRTVRAVKTV